MADDHLHWRTAVHEAAHAVAGRLLGLSCGNASGDPWRAWADVPLAVDVESVVVLMAGAVGERLVLGDCDEGAADYCERWTALTDALGEDEAFLWAWTFEALADYTEAIIRLAAALMAAGSLSGDEIDALMAQ